MSNWLNSAVSEGRIRVYEYSEFNVIRKVGKGGFGTVCCAFWESRWIRVALKTLNTDSVSDSDHENFVKEYADQGNMRQYLEKNFTSLSLHQKIRMAQDIARGLLCLHKEGIIHRDLHSKNVLVHEERMMIADLGLGKESDNVSVTSTSNVIGMPAYIEPQVFLDKNYKRDKRSDIYSLGVLLWEISSGIPPFKGATQYIAISICKGERETPVRGTPTAYVELYRKCWDQYPKSRPDIMEVNKILNEMPLDLDNELSPPIINIIDSNFQQDNTRFLHSPDNSFLNLPPVEISKNWSDIHIVSMDSVHSDSLKKTKILNLAKEIFKLQIMCIRKGSLKSWRDMITWINNNKPVSQEIFEIFNSDSESFPHREVILGNFHNIGFGVEGNSQEAFQLFMQASNRGDRLGDYEVALCYERGIGVTKDIKKAIDFYEKASDAGINNEKASEDGVSNAKYMLGIIYISNGIRNKKGKALDLIKSAAENGYVPAQHYLSLYYKINDLNEAHKWAKQCEENGGWE